jgi:hypothetical protein
MKRIIPYPFLLTISIILDRVIASIAQIDAAQSLQPLFIVLISVFVAALLVQRFVKDWRRTDFIIFMVMIMLLVYEALYDVFKTSFPPNADLLGLLLIPLMIWLYALIISRRVWKSIGNPARLTSYFYMVFSMLLILQVVRFVGSVNDLLLGDSHQSTVSAIPPLSKPIHLSRGAQPDIYVIVLDGYGRADVLQKIYNYDNSQFLNALQQRGFYVATENHSNYIETPFAMAALWNFDYVIPWNPAGGYPKYVTGPAQYITDPIENNRVFNLLKEAGYTTVSFDGSADYTQIQTADIFLSDFVPISKFDSFLLAGSPLEPISNIFGLRLPIPNYTTHRLRVEYKLNKMQEIPTLIPGPKITYMHILVPHPPFVFDENGNPIDPQRPYTIADADEFPGSREEYLKGYRAQVGFINGRILETIDAILKNSKQPPVIVMMGDHGPGSMFKYDVNNPGCVWERTRNLYAIYMPGERANSMLYPSISPVNTFRVVFDTYFGTDLPLLEDRSYFMTWQYPTQVADITSTRDSLQGCTLPSNQ